jgi:hypothetical protein
MRKLLKRRYVWLGLVLPLGIAASVAVILASPSRVNQANFDRIQEGMNKAEVAAILGEVDQNLVSFRMTDTGVSPVAGGSWRDGPSWISVSFDNDKVFAKEIYFATAWETITWYAKNGAAKIGVKWD